MPHHVFLVMPFGSQERVDFNRTYAESIQPAGTRSGVDSLRTHALRPSAGRVIVEPPFSNPNARHVLRAIAPSRASALPTTPSTGS